MTERSRNHSLVPLSSGLWSCSDYLCVVCVFISFGWRDLPCFPIFISPLHTLLPSCRNQRLPSGQCLGWAVCEAAGNASPSATRQDARGAAWHLRSPRCRAAWCHLVPSAPDFAAVLGAEHSAKKPCLGQKHPHSSFCCVAVKKDGFGGFVLCAAGEARCWIMFVVVSLKFYLQL